MLTEEEFKQLSKEDRLRLYGYWKLRAEDEPICNAIQDYYKMMEKNLI